MGGIISHRIGKDKREHWACSGKNSLGVKKLDAYRTVGQENKPHLPTQTQEEPILRKRKIARSQERSPWGLMCTEVVRIQEDTRCSTEDTEAWSTKQGSHLSASRDPRPVIVKRREQQSSGMAKLLLVSNIQQKRSVTSSRMVGRGRQESATDSEEMLRSLSV